MQDLSQTNLQKKARRYLLRQISSVQTGERLPTIRSLEAESGISRTTLLPLITQFQKEGIVRRQPRQGIFKAKGYTALDSIKCLDIFVYHAFDRPEDDNEAFEHSWLSDAKRFWSGDFISSLAMEAGKFFSNFRMHYIYQNDSIQKIYGIIVNANPEAALVGLMGKETIGLILDELHVPWVSVMPEIGPTPHHHCVLSATGKTFDLLLHYLHELGHERIAKLDYGPREPLTWAYTQGVLTYYKFMNEKGLKIASHWLTVSTYKKDSAYEALERIFSAKPYPTALIVGGQLGYAYDFLKARGYTIGKDISVVSSYVGLLSEMVDPPVTGVLESTINSVQRGIKMLADVLKGQRHSKHVTADIELIVRNSAGPAPRDERLVGNVNN